MGEMSSPDSLSPNRLNQALISETLSEFPQFEFVSSNTPEQPAEMANNNKVTDAILPKNIVSYETIKKGNQLDLT